MSDLRLDPLREQARHRPGATAVILPGCVISFAGLDAYCEHIRAALSRDGVSAGTFVGLGLKPSVAFIAHLFALSRLGAVAVCLNTRTPEAVLARQLAGLGAERWIRDADISDCAFEGVACTTPISLSSDQPCTVVFTSGSSGEPKAVLHSVGNHLAAAQASNTHNGLAPGDRWLLSLPCYHVAGLGIIYRCLVAGATIVIAPDETLVDAATRYRVTHLSVVPTQLRRWLEEAALAPRDAALKSVLKSVLVGGAACPQALVEEAQAAGLPVRRTYGMTEATSQITTVAPQDAARAGANSSGTALPGVEVRVSDEAEIEIRGHGLCLGYLEHGRTHLPRTADGWFRTGDTGMLLPDGQLTVTGRRDSMFISGGENIHPEEIEQALCAQPGILQACVVPVEDPEFGHRPVAFVETRHGLIDSEALNGALAQILPRYKLPLRYQAWPQEMRGMKVRRADLARCV